MPELRATRPPAASAPFTMERESRDGATATRRRRAGRNHPHGVPLEIRNGLPFRPYVYRGVGYDIYSGDDDA